MTYRVKVLFYMDCEVYEMQCPETFGSLTEAIRFQSILEERYADTTAGRYIGSRVYRERR